MASYASAGIISWGTYTTVHTGSAPALTLQGSNTVSACDVHTLWVMQATSEVVRKALAHVRENYPYWARHDGADHFMVFSYDHGRCDMAPALGHAEWGQMFAIQSYGDLTYT